MKFQSLFISASLVASLLITGCSSDKVVDADLDRVLDVTADTLYNFEASPNNTKDDEAMTNFAIELQRNLNIANPIVHSGPIGASLETNGSILGYHDKNSNNAQDSDEAKLFTVEIDSENQRLIASDVNDNVRDHSFSGTGLLAGYLLGSMMSRQRTAGINPGSMSNKRATPKASSQSARSRAGSGSHSSGK